MRTKNGRMSLYKERIRFGQPKKDATQNDTLSNRMYSCVHKCQAPTFPVTCPPQQQTPLSIITSPDSIPTRCKKQLPGKTYALSARNLIKSARPRYLLQSPTFRTCCNGAIAAVAASPWRLLNACDCEPVNKLGTDRPCFPSSSCFCLHCSSPPP